MTLANIEPISAAQWQLAAVQRARVYDWLAALHAREIDDAGLGACFAGAFAPMLDGLAALGLTRECERLRRAIDELRTTALARLELAADFAQLFLLDARHSAPPTPRSTTTPTRASAGQPKRACAPASPATPSP